MNVIVSREHRNDGQRRVFFVKLGPRASFCSLVQHLWQKSTQKNNQNLLNRFGFGGFGLFDLLDQWRSPGILYIQIPG